jgi:spore germination protein GerM
MTRSSLVQVAVAVALLALLLLGVTYGLERLIAPPDEAVATGGADAAGVTDVGHITATLFYATPDGEALAGVRREVPLADGAVAQGRQILIAQMAAAPEGYVATIPAGTTVRAFYITAQGDAFVDLSAEVSTQHPGGSTTELLTVYTIVNAVAANLPAVRRVQILINGEEADTLAGHVDLRRPLERDVSLVRAR